MMPLPLPAFDALLRSSFLAFTIKCFHSLNSGERLSPNWCIAAMARVVERLISGDLRRVVINLPPRFLKSVIFSAAYPAFLLGQNPRAKILCISHSGELAEGHHDTFRKIVESEWYRKSIPGVEWRKLTTTQAETSQGGFRHALSVYGTLTGLGADIFIVDDPINAPDISSKTKREGVNLWYSQALLSRANNPKTDIKIVVAQRLHLDDLSGVLLETGDYERVCLPAIAPEDRTIELCYGI